MENKQQQQQKDQNYDSQNRKEDHQAQNTKDANANSQHSPENGRESNVPGSASGSNKVNQADLEIGRRLEHQDAENTNKVPNPGDRISNAENMEDKNIGNAIDKANKHNPQGASRKPDHNDDSIDAGTNPDRNTADNTERTRNSRESDTENSEVDSGTAGTRR